MDIASRDDSQRRSAALVRQRIERGGECLWRYQDFSGLPFSAVAKALSRLARAGKIQRLSKGVYFRNRQTAFGESRPNPAEIQKLAARQKTVFPSGIAAAGLLGFTTQQAKHGEVATTAFGLPRKLVGDDTVIHTRRPQAWAGLSETDTALLDFLRRGGEASELSLEGTVRKTLALIDEGTRFNRLVKVAPFEPPRVRAMLGAIGEQLGKDPRSLHRLRQSLNPLTRFDFGRLSGLTYARNWQAKEHRGRETV